MKNVISLELNNSEKNKKRRKREREKEKTTYMSAELLVCVNFFSSLMASFTFKYTHLCISRVEF